jgi:hypothetical protein
MISEMLDNGGFNTLIFDDSYAKICLIASIISEFQCKNDNDDNHHKVIYLDFDAAFTSYAKAGLIPTMKIQKINDHFYQSESNILNIFLPTQDILGTITTDIIKSISECSLVIFDSINSFYNLFYDRLVPSQNNTNIGSLNQLLYFVLMIILKHTSDYNIPFLVTSMIRYRGKELVTSNRLLSMKSSFNFYVKIRNLDDLSITVLKHPKLDHKNFIMKDKVLKWT